MVSSTGEAEPAVLGVCVVYLGGLNYFFTVEETAPVVSRIGTIAGHLHLPFSCPSFAQTEEAFEPYKRVDVDSVEEQVHEYMDRNLQYRVDFGELTGLTAGKCSLVSLRYTFFREVATQTARFRIGEEGDTTPLNLQLRHVVDVSEAFVKYITGSYLTIEVLYLSVSSISKGRQRPSVYLCAKSYWIRPPFP
ncbi:hypothetical protein BBJ28_00004215 [Nothophytophthora sp. Chile5]|nr:hypothetical protein BBJ28_00004215 [Nothophytophthora sp. Chile5]